MSNLKEKSTVFLNEALEENSSLFLIKHEVTSDHQIRVIIDSDDNVSIQDCIAVSRKIEHQLDRDEVDFSVEVASPGVSEPLVLPRQFKKNLGRKLEVKLKDGVQIKADLVGVNDDFISLEWKAREPKPIGKGKHTVNITKDLPYDEIEIAKVMVIFNKK
ncbi:ribosome assembly cofactor RimP [Psychroflexus maritimus]|uniref:Ribosome maturation factor RimP n=1 Tax=Psychroflexus maritimus TaxID=2714865 RepID=A0A967ADJ9_9FLAO|nr:ribosome assembly cofactor RimP [Psychroflexus maritimus]NGZ89755.1 ribosome assembly cofactor RimP [Psychroflexus maritimus]